MSKRRYILFLKDTETAPLGAVRLARDEEAMLLMLLDRPDVSYSPRTSSMKLTARSLFEKSLVARRGGGMRDWYTLTLQGKEIAEMAAAS